MSTGVMAGAAAFGSMVAAWVPPETKPIIEGAAGGGGSGGAPVEDKTLAAAARAAGSPDNTSLAACGRPGTEDICVRCRRQATASIGVGSRV